jgi:hypothetical protein
MHTNHHGFITIAVVITIALIALAVAVSSLALVRAGADAEQALVLLAHARAHGLGCLEYARDQLLASASYRGPDTLTFEEGGCILEPLDELGSASFRFRAQGAAGEALARVEVEVSFSEDASGSFIAPMSSPLRWVADWE